MIHGGVTESGSDPGRLAEGGVTGPGLPSGSAGALDARAPASPPGEPVTLAESLMREAGWGPENFGTEGPNPPYLRIGGKMWMTLTGFEPCFASFHRDRGPFRSKVAIADHLAKYDAIMVDPLAFEECFGPGEGTETVFPFGAWLDIRDVGFGGLELWGKRQGTVTLPLDALATASAIWLRRTARRGEPDAASTRIG
ncbi:hypothetical protein ABS772_24425 [Methylorubrum podarium]|uniref:Uncharacterized protein n=1 Tax=Methylorubrum podarium TaxID=200476 RepID=A0ABV1QUX6_9HYPH